MIEQTKILLRERNVTRAVIIDDAYDDRPAVGDVEDARWTRFFDDISEEEEVALRDGYGAVAYDRTDQSQLKRDIRFVTLAWETKARSNAAQELFSEFIRVQAAKRSDLDPLRQLLEQDLELTCRLVGRDYEPEIAAAHIIFLDLFLGHQDDDDAKNRAIDRVKRVVAERHAAPPSVVLMSSSPRLYSLGPTLRDEAELLGCQFRMVPRLDLADKMGMTERLYDLVLSYPDSLKLNTFLLAWNEALGKAKTDFLRAIRTLDLSDYANMQALILEAEELPVGDYVIDLYDLYLHNVLEGDDNLIRAAKRLNEIQWDTYPPAQFMPSPESIEIMDGAQFHNQVRTRVEAAIDADPTGVRFGDVFIAPALQQHVVAGAEAPRQLNPAEVPTRHAYVVLSQACDLQHGEADRILLLRGTLRPYSWKQHDRANSLRTPVMKVGEDHFTVEWDVLAPETWLVRDIAQKIADGYRSVRRLRTPFALQLQQSFIGRLGRVGTLAALPARYPAGAKFFVRSRDGNATVVGEATIGSDDAVCLVGRTSKNALKEWLLLSGKFRAEIRNALQAIPTESLTDRSPLLLAARNDPEFYRLLRGGIQFSRDSASKPFKDTKYDFVQVSTQSKLQPGAMMDRALHPLVIEIEIE